MSYYFARKITGSFDDVTERVTASLKAEGFGVLTNIDIAQTLKTKIGVEFQSYRILGACNPSLAHRALTAEDKIGVMLPCNVIVQDVGGGAIEIAAINPSAAMGTINNPALTAIATEVATKLQKAIAAA